MTTKPAQEPCPQCEGRLPRMGDRYCQRHMATCNDVYIVARKPATSAPSQPAGARESGLKKAQDWWDSQYPARSEGQYPTVPHALNDYAAQQTAAKDAEIADLRRQRDLEWDSRKAASSGRIAAERERDSLRAQVERQAVTIEQRQESWRQMRDELARVKNQ